MESPTFPKTLNEKMKKDQEQDLYIQHIKQARKPAISKEQDKWRNKDLSKKDLSQDIKKLKTKKS